VKVGEEEKGGQAKAVFKKFLLVLFNATSFKLKI
jgi:hypothetical protein